MIQVHMFRWPKKTITLAQTPNTNECLKPGRMLEHATKVYAMIPPAGLQVVDGKCRAKTMIGSLTFDLN